MHYVLAMDVVECTEKLVRVQLDEQRVDLLMEFLKVLLDAVDVGGDVIHHDVQLGGLLTLFFRAPWNACLLC